MDTALDAIDRRIISELEADGRLSGRAVAERVSISRANAYARIERLVADGVITGFTARVDPVKVGLTTSAYVTMTVRQRSWRDLQDQLREIPEVRHMALMGGEFDVMLLIRAADNDALRRVVLERLQAIPGVLATRTFLIFEDVGN
ncbi:MAG: Lrp/AsnC family transcriptional regulator [Pseudonocardia sp.]|nr:Lrp/AsnC family transcriptional regulator [Pseudonocardia sp.]